MKLFRKTGLLRLSAVGLLLCFLQQQAHADLWAHVDERGVTHFAAEQLDTRYQLFFRGTEFDSTRDMPAGTPATPHGMPSAGARLLAFFDIAPGYKSIKHHLRAASEQQAVDYELLQALIATESGFDAQAVSPKGAVGLMQLMPATASRFGVRADAKRSLEQKLADPAVNVSAGTRYLRYLLDLFPGRVDLALAAYNAGEGAVQRAGNQIPAFKETQNYVRTVLALYHQLKPPAPVQAHRAAPGRVRMQLQGGAHNRGNLPPDTVVAHSRASNEPLPTIPNE
ncbi:lytic transglycosylase domain-containing protein [Acidovorax temperans]|uniref:lytic transglycosylase domain-containing protein n=1 Tax=Acidovorax temperans TaxID=80878 RepID=UPI0030D356A4